MQLTSNLASYMILNGYSTFFWK